MGFGFQMRDAMESVQQIVPISEMKLHHAEVLARLRNGPVILAQRSRPAAVLVSVEQWDAIVEELDTLWAEREAAISKWKLATGKSQLKRMSDQEPEEWLAEDEPVL